VLPAVKGCTALMSLSLIGLSPLTAARRSKSSAQAPIVEAYVRRQILQRASIEAPDPPPQLEGLKLATDSRSD
jgi:hypothetical protein